MLENVGRMSSQLLAYGSADVAILVVNFLLLPVYTRVLSPEEYGVLALLIACEAFLKVLFRWGLDVSFLRFHYDYPHESDRREMAGTIAIILLAANGTLLVLMTGAAGPIGVWLLGSRGYGIVLILLLVNLFLSTFLFLPLNLLRVQQRARRFAWLTFLRSFGTVVARLVLVVALGMGVLGIILADVVVSGLLFAGLARTMHTMTAFRFSRRMAGELLRFGLPRVPQGLMHQGMAVSDRFILGLYLPLADVGLYLVASSIASLTKLYTVSFGTAWMPFAFDAMARADAPRLFARMGSYAFAFLVLVSLAVSTLSESLVRIMTPAAFHPATRIVPLLAAGIAVQALAPFLTTALNVAKKTTALPLTTALSAVATIVGHVLLIPRWGVMGAAAAVCLGQVVLTLSLGIIAQRTYPVPYEWGRLAKLTLLGIAWYAMATAMVMDSPWWTLVARGAFVATFPAGLLAVRFFTPRELDDLKRVLRLVAPARSAPRAL